MAREASGQRYGSSYDPRPVIHGTLERPVPGDVTIISGHMRAGNVLRDRYENHLAACWSQGMLSDSEFRARTHAAHAAVVDADLQNLLADLPPLPPTRQQEADTRRTARQPFAKWFDGQQPLSGALTILGSALAGAMPGVIIAALRASSGVQVLVTVPALIFGIAGVIAGIASLIAHYDA